MEQAEQDQLTRQVGRALLTVADEGWTEVRAEYRSAGRHIEVDVFVTGPDGAPRPVRPPVEVVDGLGKLRQGMYRPGRGTWLSARYLLEPPSSFSAEFEPDVEPRWRRLPPPIGFADELRFYPRADEHIPGWLRQRAGLPPTGDQPPTPPGGIQQLTPDQQGHSTPGGPGNPGPGAPGPGSAGPRYGEPGPAEQPGHPAAPIPMQSGQPGGPPPGQPHPPRPDFPPPGPAHPYPPGTQQPGPPPNGTSMSFQHPGGQFSQPAW
jgi:hypothetical protein